MTDPSRKGRYRFAKAAENGKIVVLSHTVYSLSEEMYQRETLDVLKRLYVTFPSPGLWNIKGKGRRRKSPGDPRPGVEDAAMGCDPPSPPLRPHPTPRHPRFSLVLCSVTDLKMLNMKSNYQIKTTVIVHTIQKSCSWRQFQNSWFDLGPFPV